MVDDQGHCWIIDFGLAALCNGRHAAPAQSDGDGSAPEVIASGVMGTYAYMAPEQFKGFADEPPTSGAWAPPSTNFSP